jgi:hypothetical protein
VEKKRRVITLLSVLCRLQSVMPAEAKFAQFQTRIGGHTTKVQGNAKGGIGRKRGINTFPLLKRGG